LEALQAKIIHYRASVFTQSWASMTVFQQNIHLTHSGMYTCIHSRMC